MHVVQPDNREAFAAKRMNAVLDSNISSPKKVCDYCSSRAMYLDEVCRCRHLPRLSQSVRNPEYFRLSYGIFRRPGDLHAYFFGGPLLSCANGIETQSGDLFGIDVPLFSQALRNTMVATPAPALTVLALWIRTINTNAVPVFFIQE